MSERGIEIHNGELVFPEGMPQTLHLGTEASPLTQGEADQIIVSAVVNALALGGTVEAGVFIVVASVSLTGDLRGLRAGTIINDGIDLVGSAHGAYLKQSMLGTSTITGFWEGMRIDMTMAAGVVHTGDTHGIFISNYLLGTIPDKTYYMLRMQENGTVKIHTYFYLRAGSGGVTYCALLHGTPGAWNCNAPNPSGAAGWIKCSVSGKDRWIQLYGTAP